MSASGLVYTVVLPANLEWSDGAPITVADVVATEAFALSTGRERPNPGDRTPRRQGRRRRNHGHLHVAGAAGVIRGDADADADPSVGLQ